MANNKEVIITREQMLEGKSQEKRTLDEINALQDIKPNIDLNSIHPDFIAVLRSYDQVNGSVFNGKTRQNIIRKLIYRAPDSKLTNYKLASAKLANELAKAANLLETNDNRLYKTADNTLNIIEEKNIEMFIKEASFKKVAWFWIATGIAAAIGLLYAQNHSPNATHNIGEDGKKLVEAIEELANSGSGIFENTYTPQFITAIKKVEADANTIIGRSSRLETDLIALELGPELTNRAKTDKKVSDKLIAVKNQLKSFSDHTKEALTNVARLSAMLQTKQGREQFTESESTLNNLGEGLDDLAHGALFGGWGYFSDKLTSFSRILTEFQTSCNNFIDYHNKFLQSEANAKSHAEEVAKATTATNSGLPPIPAATPATADKLPPFPGSV